MALFDRVKNGWNAFMSRDPTNSRINLGPSYYSRPDRTQLSRGNERSTITAIYNRIAVDAAQCEINHVRVDENGNFLEILDTPLNERLNLSANLDQTGRAFLQDVYMSMFDEGCIAMVPIDTTIDPFSNDSFKIDSIRVGEIIEWYPKAIKVKAYNEETGRREEIIVSKKTTAIIENPFYAVMNRPNSTVQRLTRKLNILDAIDEQSGSGKLDLIIQLPYSIRSEARKQQAKERRADVESQLSGSKFGIAYIDSTEHITQLNRSVENNLMNQIEYLTSMVYSQLGITKEIMDGTADEKVMSNYFSRTIEPILSAIVDEMKRKFLTETARTQRQSIKFFRDPFKLVPVTQIAEMSDKLTRNEILTSNEFRQIIGRKPSGDPNADTLRNKNLSPAADAQLVDIDGNVIANPAGSQASEMEEPVEELI